MVRIFGALILLLAATATVPANDDPPLTPPPAAPSAESRSNDGLALAKGHDWRAILARLRPLDPREADELAEAIRKASARR